MGSGGRHLQDHLHLSRHALQAGVTTPLLISMMNEHDILPPVCCQRVVSSVIIRPPPPPPRLARVLIMARCHADTRCGSDNNNT
jgi:hypothetical protein